MPATPVSELTSSGRRATRPLVHAPVENFPLPSQCEVGAEPMMASRLRISSQPEQQRHPDT
ncbi:hypothetical protein OE88DRAFT_1663790 [Heliocybe sulcata]|uniref:Uncharacterized protein n=1 Tax=Heliocybe sulcata TaxID=5364 RepID=A0A5C3MTK5_9AGAM|nr:hypothetical protein OE88DRAFT_1663790 [Heliocybe sulcata]